MRSGRCQPQGSHRYFIIRFVLWKALASIVFFYFMVTSLVNVGLAARDLGLAAEGRGPTEQAQYASFLRRFIALNAFAALFMGAAGVVVWFNWRLGLAAALIPVLVFFVSASLAPLLSKRR